VSNFVHHFLPSRNDYKFFDPISDRPPSDTPATHLPPKLLDQVRDTLRVKHDSIRIERAYVDWIKR
jgi:hypothetical protein